MLQEFTHEIQISTDKGLIDIDFVFNYLNKVAYWSKGISRELVEKSIEHSLCFSVLLQGKQIGFARLVTDYATFAYLGDVFIDPAYRGKGYSKQMMQFIVSYPGLEVLRRWILMTSDAHGLYQQFGFTTPAKPEIVMERVKQNPYG